MQVLALATAALSQGPALSQAGTDLLRSKSLDRNSFDSGDWFNAIHWDCRDGNGFGRGLPPAADNQDKWSYATPLLTRCPPPGCAEIDGTSAAYRDLLRIRTTEPAFGLATAGQVQAEAVLPALRQGRDARRDHHDASATWSSSSTPPRSAQEQRVGARSRARPTACTRCRRRAPTPR